MSVNNVAKPVVAMFVSLMVSVFLSMLITGVCYADDGNKLAMQSCRPASIVAYDNFANPTTPLQAAAKTKTVANQKFTTWRKTIEKKATKVKTGKTKLVVKKGAGYIKFVAPKTKKYAFTFSDARSPVEGPAILLVTAQQIFSSRPILCNCVDVATAGGSDWYLRLAVNGWQYDSGTKLERPLSSRTGTIKLKKGEPIYFNIDNDEDKRCTLQLQVK